MKMKHRINVKTLLAIIGFAAINVLFVASVTGTSYTGSHMQLAAMDYSHNSVSMSDNAQHTAVAESGKAAHAKL